jgi:hypothetical protein
MLEVAFNGQPPGSRLTADGGKPFSVTIAGNCSYHQPIQRLEVVVNGEIVRVLKPQAEKLDTGAYRFPFQYNQPIQESSWVVVRAFSEQNGRLRFVHSAPVQVAIPGRPLRPARKEIRYFIRRMQEEIARNQTLLDAESLDEYRKALEVFQQLEQTAR